MLNKIAQIANELDQQGRYSLADSYTRLLQRFAQSQMIETDETNELDVPEYNWNTDWQGGSDIQADDNRVLDFLRETADPAFVAEYLAFLEEQRGTNRGKEVEHSYGGYNIKFPKGVGSYFGNKKWKRSDLVNFLLGPKTQQLNSERARDWYSKATRGGKARAHALLDYPQSSKPEERNNRRMILDPRLDEYTRSVEMPPSNREHIDMPHMLGFWDPKALRSIIDPNYADADTKIRDTAWAPPEDSEHDWNEEQLSVRALNHARRHFDPRILQRMKIAPREVNPESGVKEPNFYYRHK